MFYILMEFCYIRLPIIIMIWKLKQQMFCKFHVTAFMWYKLLTVKLVCSVGTKEEDRLAIIKYFVVQLYF